MVEKYSKTLDNSVTELAQLSHSLHGDQDSSTSDATLQSLRSDIDGIKELLRRQAEASAADNKNKSPPPTSPADDPRPSKRQKPNPEEMNARLVQLKEKMDELEHFEMNAEDAWAVISPILDQRLEDFFSEREVEDDLTPDVPTEEVLEDILHQTKRISDFGAKSDEFMARMQGQVQDLASVIAVQQQPRPEGEDPMDILKRKCEQVSGILHFKCYPC